MAKVPTIMEDFIHMFKDEIFSFYNRSYSYIKEILIGKNINLRRRVSQDSEIKRQKTIETMLEAIRLAFMTIGIPKSKLEEDVKQLEAVKSKKKDDYLDYIAYFEVDLKDYIDQILLDILIEYLIDVDIIKMGNLDLFDLLPRNFIKRLKEFKKERINSAQIKESIKKQMLEVKKDFIPAEFLVKEEEIKLIEVIRPKEILEPKKVAKPQAPPKPKKEMVVTVATPEIMKKFAEEKEEIKIAKAKKVAPLKIIKKSEKNLTPESEAIIQEIPRNMEFQLPKKPKLFLDYIGNFAPINPKIIEKFNIDIVNLIDTKDNKSDFFSLENLFFYITILRMLNINIPLTETEIINILKNYVKGDSFCASKEAKPDPLNNFYGLAILSELDLLYNNNVKFMDLKGIEMFLESELKDFIPEKLHLNFFTILCLKILEKSGGLTAARAHLINPILSLDILSSAHAIKEYNPILDIFEHLASIKTLEKNADLSHFKALYNKEIKKLITEKGVVNNTITDSARSLLIIDLLGLKKAEFNTCQHLLNYVISGTRYFNSADLKRKFNWKEDKWAYSIELRMLFWALMSASQYKLLL